MPRPLPWRVGVPSRARSPSLRSVDTFCLAALLCLTSGGREPPLTFALAGDVSVARTVSQANTGAWARALAGVRDVLRGDAVFANLESPLTDQPFQGGQYDLRAPLAGVAALKPFSHLSVANNHALDGGAGGQRQNQAVLRRNGIDPVTPALTITRLRGVPVAWIGFLDDGKTPLPLAAVRAAAQQARIVVVSAHWGEEYGLTTARQREQARALAQAGATLIVGSGPHVLQGTERLGKTLVLYSLGNLLLDQPFPAARIGAVVRVQVGQDITACAVPTRYRAGRAELAPGWEKTQVLKRLGLGECASK